MARNGTAQDIADYMIEQYFLDQGDPVKFIGDTIGDRIEVNLQDLPAESKQLARWAMDAWESVADVHFKVVRGKADVVMTDNGRDGAAAAIYDIARDGELLSARIDISADRVATHGGTIDGFAFQTYLHELGHILGLGHSGDYDLDHSGASPDFSAATFRQDSWALTVMSYFGQDENPHVKGSRAGIVMPMEADILAVQQIFGAAASDYTAGNTVWGIGSTLDNWLGEMFTAMEKGDRGVFASKDFALYIDDTSGHDRIDFSYDGRTQDVDLRPGQVSDILGRIGNLILTEDTVIEDYFAGGGNDTIRGNGENNMLRAGNGADVVVGQGGNDRIWGEAGDDKLVGGAGRDMLDGGVADDILIGGAGSDRLVGDFGNDRLMAGGGNDKADGGLGDDSLFGQGGNDRLFGGGGSDRLDGGGGNDRLDGSDGEDLLFGKAGGDVMSGGNGSDRILGGGGADRIDGGTGADNLVGQGGGDLLVGGDGLDILSGGGGRDRLEGGASSDMLTGGAGRDTFVFDGGTDTITDFQAGLDQVEIDATAIWGTGPQLTVEEILGTPRELNGELMFVLATGARLVFEGVTVSSLSIDDLQIA